MFFRSHRGQKFSLMWHLCTLVQCTHGLSFTDIFCTKSNLLQQRSKSNRYDSLQYFHKYINNCNKNLSFISILWAVFQLAISGTRWKQSHQISIISTSNTYLDFFIYSLGTQEEFVKFVHGISDSDSSWYYVN